MEEKREELALGHSQQQRQSPWKEDDEDKKGEDDDVETRQNDEIPTQTPDESQHMDNLGVEGATEQQMKGAESSGVRESSQKEITLEQLEENAVAQQQNMKVFWWFSLCCNAIISSTSSFEGLCISMTSKSILAIQLTRCIV